MVPVFEAELSFGVCGVRTPLPLVCFDFLSLRGLGGAEFFVRGLVARSVLRILDGQSSDFFSEALAAGLATTFSSFEDDPD